MSSVQEQRTDNQCLEYIRGKTTAKSRSTVRIQKKLQRILTRSLMNYEVPNKTKRDNKVILYNAYGKNRKIKCQMMGM